MKSHPITTLLALSLTLFATSACENKTKTSDQAPQPEASTNQERSTSDESPAPSEAENETTKNTDNAEELDTSKSSAQETFADNSEPYSFCDSGNCKCGDGYCAKNATCIQGNCYCFNNSYLSTTKIYDSESQAWIAQMLKGNDAGEFTCYTANGLPDTHDGPVTMISYLKCDNEAGCSTSLSKIKYSNNTCLIDKGAILDKKAAPYNSESMAYLFADCLDKETALTGRTGNPDLSASISSSFDETELLTVCGNSLPSSIVMDYSAFEKLEKKKKAELKNVLYVFPKDEISSLCNIRKKCDSKAIPEAYQKDYACTIDGEFIPGFRARSRLLPKVIGLKCINQSGCECGSTSCKKGEFCNLEGICSKD